ncbi:very long chain fatty acid elongase 7-like [Plodia interpunctella]|uniref:very long chain fatty acid elongase 7-like n=1 Tax=Plodia interpunctella TaxID=58824 RepID=UPI0023687E81|nr:elongation of very long chain fatty acids protein 7-like [Plodia interpunctella]
MDSPLKYIVGFPAKHAYVDDWFLMSSPIPVILIWISYLLFVLKVGPAYMKNREAFKLFNLLKVYNLFQVAFSLVQFLMAWELVKPAGYIGITCDEDEQSQRRLNRFIYIYFWAKFSELADTVLFVLRKKQNQVSFLHVYHHSITLLATWYTLKIEPVQATAFLAYINSFVHVVMYAYYGLSAFPALTKYLWWKRYITAMQVFQFVCVIIHAVGNYIYSDCAPSYILLFTIIINEALFIYLFGEFFVRSYITPKRKADKAENAVKAD